MWKELVLDYASALRDAARSNDLSPLARLSDAATYSVKSLSSDQQTIFALKDSYLDLSVDGRLTAGTIVFSLNTFELDRQTFKLERELALLELSERRLDPDYVSTLILKPLQAAIETAQSDLDVANDALKQTQDRFNIGLVTLTDLKMAQARVADKTITVDRAQLALNQRQLDLETLRRRLDAEKADLKQRTELNEQIRKVHQFAMPFAGTVTAHSYTGAFVEKGDPICTISR
jgi:multidrug resistance efflux pump